MAVDGSATKIGLPPLARADAHLFILGSLPGDVSLAERRYYAHPTNQFWRLLGAAIAEDLQAADYQSRCEILARRRIGLWDVIASASRSGSLDQAIRSAEHNRIAQLLGGFPDLRAVAFNGSTAAAIGRRLIGSAAEAVELVDLPSSSAANTRPFPEKAVAWRRLATFLQD